MQRGHYMPLEENKAIVRGYMENILNKRTFEKIDNYLATEFTFNGRHLDIKQVTNILQSEARGFPDLRVTIEDQIAEGDKVVTRVRFQGTHQGEVLGIAPTGKHVTYTGIAIDRIVNGKVVEMWHEADNWGVFKQLSIISIPE